MGLPIRFTRDHSHSDAGPTLSQRKRTNERYNMAAPYSEYYYSPFSELIHSYEKLLSLLN